MNKSGFPFALALLIAFASPARAATKEPDPADDFFGPDKFHTVHIRMTEDAWDLMQPTRRPRPMAILADSIPDPASKPRRKGEPPPPPVPELPRHLPVRVSGETLAPNNFGWEYVYVASTVEIDGQPLANAAVRFKGNSSYDNFNRVLRRPFKVDFDRFVPGRKFRGLGSLNLNNNAFDPSCLREALSYEVYRRCGLPAPRTAFAVLHLTVEGGRYDHSFCGVYTLIEEMDEKAFLKAHFADPHGILLKPEGLRGLPYLGENWATYAEKYRAKTEQADPRLARRFIEAVKLLNYADDATFAAKASDYFDVDAILRYLAATTLIANLDSALVTGHNYYLYSNPSDQRISLMPWDMNLSFAGYGSTGPRDDQVYLSIAHPWAGHIKLFDRLMTIDANQKAYRAHLRDFVGHFYNPTTMNGLMDTMQAALRKADDHAAAAGHPTPAAEDTAHGGGFGNTRYTIRQFIAGRVRSVLDQLDGKETRTFEPAPTPHNLGFNWGVHAAPEYGNLVPMAEAVRRAADTDGDYRLTPREVRDAAASLFYQLVDEENPDSIDAQELARGLTPLMNGFGGGSNARSRGFFGFMSGNTSTGAAWANALFRAADTDADGKLTLVELTTFADQLHCLADRDQNGLLDDREIIEALDLLAAPTAEPSTTNRRPR